MLSCSTRQASRNNRGETADRRKGDWRTVTDLGGNAVAASDETGGKGKEKRGYTLYLANMQVEADI
jgi:hypothetical protein